MKNFLAAILLIALLGTAAFADDTITGSKGKDMVAQFLKNCRATGAFFIATIDNENQPRVRPFSSITEHNDKLYICTNNQKNVYRQIMANPKVEISGVVNGEWIRLTTKLVEDDSVEAKQAVLDQNPELKGMYKIDDGIFVTFYFDDVEANILSFTGRDDKIKF